MKTNPNEKQEIDQLLTLVDVDPEKGSITWKTDRGNGRIKAGSPAGCKTPKGYTRIKFNGLQYRNHRIIFYYVHGYLPVLVDHKHGVEFGDGIDNLQDATHSENSIKKNRNRNNTSGFRGVSIHSNRKHNPYQAQIKFNGKTTHIGYFPDPESASVAYEEMAKRVFGEVYTDGVCSKRVA